ncbi:MAG: hypothetical protein JST23_03965 [Bacteroidetes bacterium]|nr:hypothetical protein [Bacteroidota bacterium]
MMKLILPLLVFALVVIACNSNEKNNPTAQKDKKVVLHTDTLNVVKLSDTLVIYESTCRGCAFEGSTSFSIDDSLGIVALDKIETIDNNPPDMAGGSVSKNLIIVPKKTGTTKFKLYKFYKEQHTAQDSANAVSYSIEVKN